MSQPSITIIQIEDDYGFNLLFNIRTRVFVEEISLQDEDDYDGFDHLAMHYLASYENEAVGTGRIRIQPVSGRVKLERIAVLPAFRDKGIGTALVKKMIADVPDAKHIYLHSLKETIGFFEKMGFVQDGEPFEEAGRMQARMTLD